MSIVFQYTRPTLTSTLCDQCCGPWVNISIYIRYILYAIGDSRKYATVAEKALQLGTVPTRDRSRDPGLVNSQSMKSKAGIVARKYGT